MKKNDDFSFYSIVIKETAEKLHKMLTIQSNCFDEDGVIRKIKVLVAFDDDKTSAYETAFMYHFIFKTHGYYPKVLAVGGKGSLSKKLFIRTEGKILAAVCNELGVHKDDITILDKGSNSGENILAINSHMNGNKDIICFCSTQRLSLRTKLTQEFQAPELNACYFVIEETIDEAAKWLNFKRVCKYEMLYQELAAIYPRCKEYDGIFQAPIPEDIMFKINDYETGYMDVINFFASNYHAKIDANKIINKSSNFKLFVNAVLSIPKAKKENRKYIQLYKEKIANLKN